MNEPAFSPITTTELVVYAVLLAVLPILGSVAIQWSRRKYEREQGRANHPTSKGLPRK